MFTQEFMDRFNLKWRIDSTTGCWQWTASCAGKGYGQMKLPKQRRQEYAHRISYQIHYGEIPVGKYVCHTCDNPKCVNPGHLFIGTSADNHEDMKSKGRHLFGERNSVAKVTEKDVLEIKEMLNMNIPQTRIAKAYGISQIEVSRINTGQRWSHVK